MQVQTAGRTRLLPLIRRLVRRHHRLLAALLLCAAAGLAVQALTPAPLSTAPVVVASGDLPAGTVLAPGHLHVQPYPGSAGPPGSAAVRAEVIGRRLASPLRAGSPVLDTSLVGPGLLAGSPPGTVAVPVRPADPSTVQLVAPGQLVDIVLSSGDGLGQPAASIVLARSVPVLWKADGGAGNLLGSTPPEGLVVVAASPAEATALAGSSSRGQVFLVLVG